jgi:hypothetical protein
MDHRLTSFQGSNKHGLLLPLPIPVGGFTVVADHMAMALQPSWLPMTAWAEHWWTGGTGRIHVLHLFCLLRFLIILSIFHIFRHLWWTGS